MARKNGPGRPTPYKPEYPKTAYGLALLGYTDKEIADHFGIHETTLYKWKDRYPEFAEQISKGKLPVDYTAAQALLKRALGYSHQAVKIIPLNGRIVREEYTQHYPPDTNALKFWLMNRRPDKWRDKSIGTNKESDDRLEELINLINHGPAKK